jgi:murein DD-endopeptidase MepM/ murein hydrolase activator NlpD
MASRYVHPHKIESGSRPAVSDYPKQTERRPSVDIRSEASARNPVTSPYATAKTRRPAAHFTLQHGERLVRFGPVAFWTVVGTLALMAGWSVVTATYFAFQDDVLARVLAREAEMQSAYEDRIAEMRSQVDRTTSRQLLDQEQLGQKLEQIMRRQSVLEQRAATLSTLADPTFTGATRGGSRSVAPQATPRPSPISLTAPFDTPARMESRASAMTGTAERAAGLQALLARLTESLDRLESRENNALAQMEESYAAKEHRIRGVFSDLGLDPARKGNTAVGGPFVAYRSPTNAGSFEKEIYRINVERAKVEQLAATLRAVPLRKPVDGEIDTTSVFGVRIDPFLGRPAMHTGIDFRGDTGDAIRVTAAGTVVFAGWSSGYGRMVEVDHGNGLATRYGHLSAIDVKVGQVLKAGQTVGLLGSTGRSTGPHLHYETRVNGEAVDPAKFLHAGSRFGML